MNQSLPRKINRDEEKQQRDYYNRLSVHDFHFAAIITFIIFCIKILIADAAYRSMIPYSTALKTSAITSWTASWAEWAFEDSYGMWLPSPCPWVWGKV